MAFSIDEFKSRFKNGGARSTLFEVQLDSPPLAQPQFDEDVKFFIQAAQIPSSIVGTIPVSYFGRQTKIAGDRIFEPWNVQVLNDEDFKVRDLIEGWSARLNGLQSNVRLYPQERDYKSSATVTQFAKTGEAIRRYKFVGLWPSQIGPIELSWEAENQIEVFNTLFEYDYYVLEDVGSVDAVLLGDTQGALTNLL